MKNKLLINIIVANLLWSFIPIVVSDLFNSVSIIMILFLRFLISGFILLFLCIILVYINNKFTHNERISFRFLFGSLLNRNRRFFYIKNISYYALIGFVGIIIQILFFFLTLKTTSITFTMTGFLLSIILIALYESGINFEKFDVFKLLYVIMLAFSMIILIYIGSVGSYLRGKPIGLNGIIYLLLFSITISFMYISINKDAYSKEEANFINKNKNYKIPKFLLKMSLSFLFGIIGIIPFTGIISIIPIKTDLTEESITFFKQFSEIFSIVERWEILFLIIFSTIIPYLLIYTSNAYWKSETLTYSQWNSILNTIDPMGSIIFSIIFVNEYFPLVFLIIFLFLLFITIAIRYAHEVKNLVQAFILIRIAKGAMNYLPTRLLKYYGVTSVDALIGTEDLLVNVKTASIKDFYDLFDKRLKPISQIEKFEILFVNKMEILQSR